MFIMMFSVLVLLTADDPWVTQECGATSRLRGLCVVDSQVVWASGANGVVVRTADAGRSWKRCDVPDAQTLDFRDLEAFDPEHACVLSIGPGAASRIYKTEDGGKTWRLVFQNADERVFLDAIAFWDAKHGIALGDPVEGRFTILVTHDAGETWSVPEHLKIPKALPGEGAFAASGTCLAVQGGHNAWFATGGAGKARVFYTNAAGHTWQVAETPVDASNPASGLFSLTFRNPTSGIAVGGDYQRTDKRAAIAARTEDGGRTWTLAEQAPEGYRSCVAIAPGQHTDKLAVLAAGPSGCDLSFDFGNHWQSLSTRGFHTVALAPDGTAWAVGEKGEIAKAAPQNPAK